MRKTIIALVLLFTGSLLFGASRPWYDLRRFRLGMSKTAVERLDNVKLRVDRSYARAAFVNGGYVIDARYSFDKTGRLLRVSYLVRGDLLPVFRGLFKMGNPEQKPEGTYLWQVWRFGNVGIYALFDEGYKIARINYARRFFTK